MYVLSDENLRMQTIIINMGHQQTSSEIHSGLVIKSKRSMPLTAVPTQSKFNINSRQMRPSGTIKSSPLISSLVGRLCFARLII